MQEVTHKKKKEQEKRGKKTANAGTRLCKNPHHTGERRQESHKERKNFVFGEGPQKPVSGKKSATSNG